MNGEKCVIARIAKKQPITTIKIMVTKESEFNYDIQPLLPEPFPCEIFNESFVKSFPIEPIVFTGLNRPKLNSLWFVANQWVEMIQGDDCSDELFAAWFLAASNAKPTHIKTYEIDGVYTNHNQPDFDNRIEWCMNNLQKQSRGNYATS